MSAEISSFERVNELYLILLSTDRHLTRREICEQYDLYGSDWDSAATRRKFHRDLDAIRETVFRIDTKPVEGYGNVTSTGYRILPKDVELTELDSLTAEERAALRLVSGYVELDQDWDITAISKLDDDSELAEVQTPVGEIQAWQIEVQDIRHQPTLAIAAADRCLVTFTYANKERTVKPLETRSQRGRHYLAAEEDDAFKIFRIDRIQSKIKVGEAGSFEPPEPVNWKEALPYDPILMNFGEEFVCALRVGLARTGQAEDRCKAIGGQITQRLPDGSIEIEFPVRNRRGLLVWLYELGHHAKVLSPTDVIEDLKHSLTHLLADN